MGYKWQDDLVGKMSMTVVICHHCSSSLSTITIHHHCPPSLSIIIVYHPVHHHCPPSLPTITIHHHYSPSPSTITVIITIHHHCLPSPLPSTITTHITTHHHCPPLPYFLPKQGRVFMMRRCCETNQCVQDWYVHTCVHVYDYESAHVDTYLPRSVHLCLLI